MRVAHLTCTVYGLASTEAPTEIRYIGQTIRVPQTRLREQINAAKRGGNFAVNRWIRKVLAGGFDVEIVVLELNAMPGEAEIRWIAQLRADGKRLVNATIGGPGVTSPGAETRTRMSLAKKGIPKSEAHRAKLRAFQVANPSLGFKGHTHSDDAKARFSRKGSKHTPETRALMAAQRTGRKHSEATKLKIWQVRRARAAERAALATYAEP